MKVGDVIKFSYSGVIGTVVKVTETVPDSEGIIYVQTHGVEETVKFPASFKVDQLKRCAEVISESR